MGEVWRALDTRLGREVAIKVLPEAVASDPSRAARLEREARLLAALNHPAIATIHGFEQADGVSLLVLELVNGPTLAERLHRGPLPVREALAVACQIAEALEAAHEKGIIHRDLKPSNVKLAPDGRVKLLDFGLAKALDGEGAKSDVSKLSTETSATDAGVVLGTAAYMSPEQARGEPVDERTDIWAFGCVLYETLTGKRAFAGATGSDVLAAILEREPDWTALPEATPSSVRSLLLRCLGKKPDRRLRAIADARLEIEDGLRSPPNEAATRGVRQMVRPSSPWLAAILAAAAVGAMWFAFSHPGARPLAGRRFQISLPSSTPFAESIDTSELIALTPDGSTLVFESRKPPDGPSQLFRRRLDEIAVRPIPGTEGSAGPLAVSPDGRWLAFAAAGKLKKVPIEGGAAVTVCDGPSIRGASWGDDGTIVFAPGAFSGLFRVSGEGGRPTPLTSLDPDRESSHRWPQMLPRSQAVIYTARAPSGRQSRSRIEGFALETGARVVLVEGGSFGRYVPTGHLVYALAGKLYAVPFDAGRLRVTGPAAAILDDVRMSFAGTGVAHFAYSPQGLLAYVAPFSRPGKRSLVWVDREGHLQPVMAERRTYSGYRHGLGSGVRLSPDGERVTVTILGDNVEDSNLWEYHLRSAAWRRLTADGETRFVLWAPDGGRLAVSSSAGGAINIYATSPDGSGAVRLTRSLHTQFVTGWSPDGRTIAFSQMGQESDWDIWVLPLDGDRQPRPLVATRFAEGGAVFSRDGRWIAYASNEAGAMDVYVRPYPEQGEQRWRVSSSGGVNPMWSPSGGEILYRAGRALVAVPVTTAPSFRAGTPRTLFEGRFGSAAFFNPAPFDVSRDGRRFLMVLEDEEPDDRPQIVVAPDWFEELKATVPRSRQ
jgi:serine/threonine-protein kinase